jgi:hypothetical protein
MSSADARAEQASNAARTRWEQEGNPVVSRAVETVDVRRAELTDEQRAVLRAIADAQDTTEAGDV